MTAYTENPNVDKVPKTAAGKCLQERTLSFAMLWRDLCQTWFCRKLRVMLIAFSMMAVTGTALADEPLEIHSNGFGGGLWSDPGTWRDERVPMAADDIVIASGDTVVFDGDAEGRPAGGRLTIDPRGVLAFDDSGVHVLVLEGPIVSYGIVRMDASRMRRGRLELRLAGATREHRQIRLLQRSGLLVYGRDSLRDDQRNAVLAAGVDDSGENPRRLGPPLRIVAGTEARAVAGESIMLDIHHARLDNVEVVAARIDNTGAFADQRLNLLNNQWSGASRISLHHCDTPFVHHNVMTGVPGRKMPGVAAALRLDNCRLADVRGNRVSGDWPVGIEISEDIDSALTENSVSGCRIGVSWHGRNAMIKTLDVENAGTAIRIRQASGVVEAATLRNVQTNAVALSQSEMQLTDTRIVDAATNAVALRLDRSSVTLLNTNIDATDVRIDQPPGPNQHAVQRMEYLVVGVRGRNVPSNALIDVRTAAVSGRPPEGRADLNVRNSPTRLHRGITPLPRSHRPLVLRSWHIERDGTRRDAPFYDLRVLKPGAERDVPPEVLHEQVIEPGDEWFRPEPNDPEPTIEVRL